MDPAFLLILVIVLIWFALAILLAIEDAMHDAERQRRMADTAAKRWDKFKQRHDLR